MRISKILSGIFVLTPAVLLVISDSILGAAKGDDCKIKPDGSAPAGLHWYYRVDRTNNRHCWYLHAQGMPVHPVVDAAQRGPDGQSDKLAEEVSADVSAAPPAIASPQPLYEQVGVMANRAADFTSRWVDLPKSVDLNAHGVVPASNGYAAEQGAAKSEEQFPSAWPGVSTVNGELRQNSPAGTSFGSISLAGAAVLALLLISEALVRFVRRSGWNLMHRRLRVNSHRRSEESELTIEPAAPDRQMPAPAEPMSRAQTGADELRRVLQRAGAGLRPPRSFAPSRATHSQDLGGRARAQSTLQRLKSRSFNGMTWAPL